MFFFISDSVFSFVSTCDLIKIPFGSGVLQAIYVKWTGPAATNEEKKKAETLNLIRYKNEPTSTFGFGIFYNFFFLFFVSFNFSHKKTLPKQNHLRNIQYFTVKYNEPFSSIVYQQKKKHAKIFSEGFCHGDFFFDAKYFQQQKKKERPIWNLVLFSIARVNRANNEQNFYFFFFLIFLKSLRSFHLLYQIQFWDLVVIQHILCKCVRVCVCDEIVINLGIYGNGNICVKWKLV